MYLHPAWGTQMIFFCAIGRRLVLIILSVFASTLVGSVGWDKQQNVCFRLEQDPPGRTRSAGKFSSLVRSSQNHLVPLFNENLASFNSYQCKTLHIFYKYFIPFQQQISWCPNPGVAISSVLGSVSPCSCGWRKRLPPLSWHQRACRVHARRERGSWGREVTIHSL